MKLARDKKILFFSRFPLTEKGGGGCRRELQIARALSPLDFKFKSVMAEKFFPGFRDKIRAKKQDHPYWRQEMWRYVSRLRVFSEKWAKKITKDTELVILDDPLFFPSLAKKVSKLGIKLVVTCQNIESLSRSQINPLYQSRLIRTEMGLLGMADLIITISREETFFLTNMDFPTCYLPYFPVASIQRRLLKIREGRKNSNKSGILLLGTVNNEVTREGFLEAIRFWKEKSAVLGQPLIVAGYGTKAIENISSGDGIRFRGTVSDAELDRLLVSVKACLCYQKSGAGVLTRICEMLLAGIPVLANVHSARSYYQTPGVIEFDRLVELETILPSLDQFEAAPIPEPARPGTDLLLARIQNLIDQPGLSHKML